jgi:ABC-type bacteriocin/lantibiotic exporter with double-glycine peptidase domain
MGRSIRRVIFLLLLLRLAASASDANGIWIDVPFVQQQKDGCGAASIAMVMQYWLQHQGEPMSPVADSAQILRALHSDTGHGIYASDMVRYFQRNGYRTFEFAGQWDDLARHLAKGRPLIAALNPGSGLPLHYVVVAGVDPDHQFVLLNDPEQRKLLKEDKARFVQEWKAAGHWTLLAVPEVSAR